MTVDISDDEFESLLDASGRLQSSESAFHLKSSVAPKTDDEIYQRMSLMHCSSIHGSGAPGIK